MKIFKFLHNNILFYRENKVYLLNLSFIFIRHDWRTALYWWLVDNNLRNTPNKIWKKLINSTLAETACEDFYFNPYHIKYTNIDLRSIKDLRVILKNWNIFIFSSPSNDLRKVFQISRALCYNLISLKDSLIRGIPYFILCPLLR